MKNGDAEPELDVLEAEEDVLNESWSESPPPTAIGLPGPNPTPALPFDEGDEGKLAYPLLPLPGICFLL